MPGAFYLGKTPWDMLCTLHSNHWYSKIGQNHNHGSFLSFLSLPKTRGDREGRMVSRFRSETGPEGSPYSRLLRYDFDTCRYHTLCTRAADQLPGRNLRGKLCMRSYFQRLESIHFHTACIPRTTRVLPCKARYHILCTNYHGHHVG